MKKALFCFALIAFAISSAASANQVDDLFQKALAAEQTGDIAGRDHLIAATLQAEPEHKLARWHSGQVLYNGKWQPLERIEELVSRDPRWKEYGERVADGDDSLDAHAEMARWCRAQGLQLEEQWHWYNVLRHDAKNREALGALKLRLYRGAYLTAEQIAAVEQSKEQAEADFRRYSKALKAAMREAELSDGPERIAAIKRISRIVDPAAITAIVEVVLTDAKNERRILEKLGNERGEKLLRQMQQAAIGALAEIPEHEATLRLMEVAVNASDADIRRDAAEMLKYREPTSFMPLLMGSLVQPIEYSIRLNMLSNGQVLLTEDYHEEGPLAEKELHSSSTYASRVIRRIRPDNPGRFGNEIAFYRSVGQPVRPVFVYNNPRLDLRQASMKAENSAQQIEAENELRELRNQRISSALETVTGQLLGNDPKAWWTNWMQFNDLYTPDRLPKFEESIEADYSHIVRMASCFVAGTPVWTQAGLVPIEEIRVGDLVLSQDPHTGELNYRPVIDRTIRPPTDTVKLGVDQETIVATRGHRFWTADNGWVMAKFLKAGQQLVSAQGLLYLQVAQVGDAAEAHNLEVGEFHTYFVGKNRVLVHDNTCPQPTTNRLPGVPGRGVTAQVAMKN
jgi:hypothetical protein